jgi:hypothetical protein
MNSQAEPKGQPESLKRPTSSYLSPSPLYLRRKRNSDCAQAPSALNQNITTPCGQEEGSDADVVWHVQITFGTLAVGA